jgi:hypothetical protein
MAPKRSGVRVPSSAPFAEVLDLRFERFFDRLIFRPRCAFGRKLFNFSVAELLAQCSHQLIVAPLLSLLPLIPESFELPVDIA